MPRRIAVTNLNASTIDILNTIRANAPLEYQNNVPVVTQENDIPAVGEIICGYPAMANIFINSLVNRIALVRMQSATFNNPYVELKKGVISFGETIEEIFVEIANVQKFSYEKAPARELKRTIPDVKTAFHVINWRVLYPVSIDDEELQRAFMNMNGVQELIAKIVDSVYRGAEYDEYLLFKYLIIKKVAQGKLYPESVDATSVLNSAEKFRAVSNQLMFMNTKYNAWGVHTNTRREDQYLFMSADFNAKFDVNVLASAFNMDKADFLGHVKLIDSFDTFDNDRWQELRDAGTEVELVTDAELELMKDVQAVLVDKEFFQIYDYTQKFTENYIGSGTYWNYWLHVRKAVSVSPFANAVVFVNSDSVKEAPDTISFMCTSYTTAPKTYDTSDTEGNTDVPAIAILEPQSSAVDNAAKGNYKFIQTPTTIEEGYAIHPYGAIIKTVDRPYGGQSAEDFFSATVVIDVEYMGNIYRRAANREVAEVGRTYTFNKVV